MSSSGTRGRGRTRSLQRNIAIEAARLISEDGVRDYRRAARKASARLGIMDERALPTARDIDDALREHQRLFAGSARLVTVRRLRESALAGMRALERFHPRLVGAVLDGTADEHSRVCLLLHADDPQEVAWFLDERRIPYVQSTRKVQLDHQRTRNFPVLGFIADDAPFDLTVLPAASLRQAPLDRHEGKPRPRASARELAMLLEEDPTGGADRSGR
ncbi:MAG: hypothetical protein U1F23_00880 [Lysobacterales bacterium]